MQLRALLVATIAMLVIGCTPPCEPITSTVDSVCHRADAGAIAPGTSFVLEGSTSSVGACVVSVDGGAISLEVTGGPVGCGGGLGGGARAIAAIARCTIPPLDAGTYTVNSQPALTFTIPGDAGVQPCF